MRLGEVLALQPGDLDEYTRTIRIARAFTQDGDLDTPKSGHGRTVNISQFLADSLACHALTRKQDKLKYGWNEMPPWMFVTKQGTPVDPANVRHAMLRVLKLAKLPLHFTPHCLRHTYASILLTDGVSPVYVQEQLGHATIELTVSTYGRWLKKKAPGALDRLDCAVNADSGSRSRFRSGNGGDPPRRESPTFNYLQWSRRFGLNGRPAVYEWKQDVFEKARCFKWFPRFSVLSGL